jgi:hypothetical protein
MTTQRTQWKKKFLAIEKNMTTVLEQYDRALGLLLGMQGVFGVDIMKQYTVWYDDPSPENKELVRQQVLVWLDKGAEGDEAVAH